MSHNLFCSNLQQDKAEQVIQSANNRVLVLPSLDEATSTALSMKPLDSSGWELKQKFKLSIYDYIRSVKIYFQWLSIWISISLDLFLNLSCLVTGRQVYCRMVFHSSLGPHTPVPCHICHETSHSQVISDHPGPCFPQPALSSTASDLMLSEI